MPSRVESAFQFVSYKIDTININLPKRISVVRNVAPLPADHIELQFAFRSPIRIRADKQYIGGLEIKMRAYERSPHDEQSILLNGDFGIAGVFQVVGNISPETEERLVKYQIPSILFPHLRAAITFILSSIGFATIAFPLINVQSVVQNLKEEIEIKDA